MSIKNSINKLTGLKKKKLNVGIFRTITMRGDERSQKDVDDDVTCKINIDVSIFNGVCDSA